MERKQKDYANGKIYTIRAPGSDKYYIGSTTQPLSKRMSKHRTDYNSYLKGKHHYVTSYKLLEGGNAYIELLENCPCTSKDELTKREGELIRLHKNEVVNKVINGRTRKEYYIDNYEKHIEAMRKYYQDNKQQAKVYQQDNKEKIIKYLQDNKEAIKQRRKKYLQDNREAIKHQRKKYYQDNKEKINQYNKQYSQANKEKFYQYSKHYREKNKENLKEAMKKYYEENKAKILERQKRYIKEHNLA